MICLKEPRCNNSLANGSSVTRLSIRDSSFSSTSSYKETNPLTISKVCNPSGIIVIKISGISVLSFIGRPLFNSCINNSVPLTDWYDVDVTKYFFTLGSNNSGAENSLTPALKSTSTADTFNLFPNIDKISAKINFLL